MSVRAVIASAVADDPSATADEITARVLAKVTKADLAELVLAEVEHAQRHHIRRTERDAFDAFAKRDTKPIDLSPQMPGLRSLFQSDFPLGNGERVLWGRATREQHEERIAFLTAMRAGIDRTIQRHRIAVEILDTHGVSCLSELPAEVAEGLAA